jgi:hypothetical protein
VIAAARLLGAHKYVFDTGASRAKTNGPLDSHHRVCVSLGEHFDPAVREIPDPPVDAFPGRSISSEPSKADTLDATADEHATCDDHLRQPRDVVWNT